jgi:hypothetical protein
MSRRFAKIGALVVACLVPSLLTAQGHPQTRAGFWFGAGLGVGSAGCDGCDGRETGLSGTLSLGGTLSPQWLLGAGTGGWTKTVDNETLTVGVLTAMVRFYPSATGGFFLLGGLGLGSVTAESGGVSQTETGGGAMIGLGYDFRVGANVSLTPYWNAFVASNDIIDFNVAQLGLSVTLH